MRIRTTIVLAAVMMVVSVTAWAIRSEDTFKARVANILAALEAQPDLIAAAQAASLDAVQPQEKAVSRTDKNAFTIIGNVFLYDSDFLSDGTPITVGIATVQRPVRQEIFFSCLGSTAAACRGTGRRQFDGWLLAGDGVTTEEYLHFLIVTKVKK